MSVGLWHSSLCVIDRSTGKERSFGENKVQFFVEAFPFLESSCVVISLKGMKSVEGIVKQQNDRRTESLRKKKERKKEREKLRG